MKYLILFLLLTSNAYPEWSGQGEVSLETRQFRDDDKDTSEDRGVSVFSRVESKFITDRKKIVIRGFGRVDQHDNDRDFIALEDGYYSYAFGENQDLELLAGYKLYNWTATEAFHPADAINSRNFDSNVESFEKKGELTLSAKKIIGDATTTFFLFPRYETPEFPGSRSRLGFGVKLEEPKWVEGKNEVSDDHYGFQGGFRFTHTINDLDYSFHIIRHMDRDNPIIETNATGSVFTPVFFRVNQFGATSTLVIESFILKIEAAYRDFYEDMTVLNTRGKIVGPNDHSRVAVGIEWTTTLENGHDMNLFLEGQGIFGLSKEKRAQQDIFQRDLFFGTRYVLNDSMGTELFASFIIDLERDEEYLYNFNFTRRWSDNWKYKTGFRVVQAPQKGTTATGLESLHQDDYVFFNFLRYF